MKLMCGICLRPIKRADIDAHRYVFSKHTRTHYCLNDARHETIIAKRKAAA
jgi:hypothetical protein